MSFPEYFQGWKPGKSIISWRDDSNVSDREKVYVSITLRRQDRYGWIAKHVCAYFTVVQLLYLWPTEEVIEMGITHTGHTPFQSSYAIWCACLESIHIKRIHLYMFLPLEPLQVFSFRLRQRTHVIDPSVAAWREWRPAKMKSTCSQLVPLLQRLLAGYWQATHQLWALRPRWHRWVSTEMCSQRCTRRIYMQRTAGEALAFCGQRMMAYCSTASFCFNGLYLHHYG